MYIVSSTFSAGLAGHTSRVAELLESVSKLSSGDPVATHRDLYLRNLSSGSLNFDAPEDLPEAMRHTGDIIKFDRCPPHASHPHHPS